MVKEIKIIDIERPVITGFYLGIGFFIAASIFSVMLFIFTLIVGYNLY